MDEDLDKALRVELRTVVLKEHPTATMKEVIEEVQELYAYSVNGFLGRMHRLLELSPQRKLRAEVYAVPRFVRVRSHPGDDRVRLIVRMKDTMDRTLSLNETVIVLENSLGYMIDQATEDGRKLMEDMGLIEPEVKEPPESQLKRRIRVHRHESDR